VGIFLHSYRNYPLDVWRFSTTRHYHICHRSGRLGDRVGYTVVFNPLLYCEPALVAVHLPHTDGFGTTFEKVFRSSRQRALRICTRRGGTRMKYLLGFCAARNASRGPEVSVERAGATALY
jgi:hypothetical protein